MIALVVQTALITFNTTIGYGKHVWDFQRSDVPTFRLVSNTSGFFAILAAMWSKTSFAITVLRISDGWVKKVIWFIIVSVNITLGFGAISTYIQCAPMQKLWYPRIPGTCWPKEVIIHYQMFTAAYSGAVDIVLAILPWKIIWPLTMNKREKIGVLLAMNMGVFAGITSFAKITQLPAINKFDLIEGIWLSILGTAESATTIMAASIPVLRALVKSHSMRAPPVRLYGSDTEIYTGNVSAIRQSTVTSKGSSPPRSIFASSLWSKKSKRADHNRDGVITGSATRGIVRTESVSVVWEPDNKEEGIGRAF